MITNSEDEVAQHLREMTDRFEADIKSLVELVFPNGPVQERHVRQASVIVRRWICDNELNEILRYLDVKTTVNVLDDEHIYEMIEADRAVDYYVSAGVKFDGNPLWALYHSTDDTPKPWVRAMPKVGMQPVKLSKALAKPVLYFEHVRFNMGEVLRFASNKLGGAHTGKKLNDREKKLERAHRYVTFGSPKANLEAHKLGAIHLDLEPTGEEVMSGIFVVVIAAAAMLVGINFNDEPFVELSYSDAT